MAPYVDERVKCDVCSGTGCKTFLVTKPCEYCKGIGKTYSEAWDEKKHQSVRIWKLCSPCSGKKTKQVSETDYSSKCEKCNGLRYLLQKKKVRSAGQKAWSNFLDRNANGFGMIGVFLLVILMLLGFIGCLRSAFS